MATTAAVVEHVVLFKFKDGYTKEVEEDMYKGLWTFKDYFPTVMSMSLGRVLAKDPHGITHVLVMRFPSKEAVATYLADEYRLRIAHKTVKYAPFFDLEYSLDFEAEVDSDPSQLYKEGKIFNDGVDHVDVFKFKEGTSAVEIEELMSLAADLPKKIQTDVVQLTSGTNYKPNDVYTHAVVIRLPSVEGLTELTKDPAYLDLLKKAEPILEDSISVDFVVSESKKQILLA